MVDSIFRHYDIRGKVGSELSIDHVYDLGKAIAYYFAQKKSNLKTISVAMDGRLHSPAIKEKLCQGFLDSGIDVIFIGTCPTPLLYFSLFTLPVDAGIMITASHNTKEYNGFKICLDKESVWGEQLQEIKDIFKAKKSLSASHKGVYSTKNCIAPYIAWLKKDFQHLIGMELSVIIDCANGAAGTVLPQLLHAMQWPHVSLLFADVDGTYPNHEADPIVEKNMLALKNALLAHPHTIGIGLDGDCDRMAPMTSEGELIVGDKLLAVFAQSIAAHHQNATIIYDTKCSSGLTEVLDAMKVHAVMSPSGHSVIKAQMKKYNGLLAGELSCHFFFKDRYFGYDDGIYAMMRLIEILVTTKKTLQELLMSFPKKYTTPELRIVCNEGAMSTIVHQVQQYYTNKPGVKLMTLDGVRVIMDDGWGMVRPSNTQPVICLRFESNSLAGLQRIKHEFIELLKPYIDTTGLQELH